MVVSREEEEGKYGDDSKSESSTSGSRGRGNHKNDAFSPSRLVSFETRLKRSGVGVVGESDIYIETKKDDVHQTNVRNEAATFTSDLKDREGMTASRDDDDRASDDNASFASSPHISRMDLAQDCVTVMNPCASAVTLEGYVLLGLRDKDRAEHPYHFPLGYLLPAGSEVTVWCSPGVQRFDATRLVAPYLLWTNPDKTLRSVRVLDPHGDGMVLIEDRTGREVSTLALTADGKVSRFVDDDDALHATENAVECDDSVVREGGLPASQAASSGTGRELLMGRYGSYTQPLQQPASVVAGSNHENEWRNFHTPENPSSFPSPVSTAAPAYSVFGEVVPEAHQITDHRTWAQHSREQAQAAGKAVEESPGRGGGGEEPTFGEEEAPSEHQRRNHGYQEVVVRRDRNEGVQQIDDDDTAGGGGGPAYAAKTNIATSSPPPSPPPLHTVMTWQHPIGPLHPPIMWGGGEDANDNDSIADMMMSPETSMRSSLSPPGDESDKTSERKVMLTSGGDVGTLSTSNKRMQSLENENSPSSSRVQRYDWVARLPLHTTTTDEVGVGGIRSNHDRSVSNEQHNYQSSRQSQDAENLSYAWGSPSSRVQRYDSARRLPLDTDEVMVRGLRWSQHRTIPNEHQYNEEQYNDGGSSSRTDADSAYFAWGHSNPSEELQEQQTSDSALRTADPDQSLMALGNLHIHDRDSYSQKSDSSSGLEDPYPSRLLQHPSGFQDVFWDEEQSIHSDIPTVSKDSGFQTVSKDSGTNVMASGTNRAEQCISKPVELRDDVEDVSVLFVLKQKVRIPIPYQVNVG